MCFSVCGSKGLLLKMKMADYNPPLKVYYDADGYKAYQTSTISKALEFRDRVSVKSSHTKEFEQSKTRPKKLESISDNYCKELLNR